MVTVEPEHTHTHTHTHTKLGMTPLGKVSAHRGDLYLNHPQHSQETDNHAPNGIRTRNPNTQAVQDQRLIPRGHWDRRETISG